MSWSSVLFAVASWLLLPVIARLFRVYEDVDVMEELRKGDAWHVIRGYLRLLPVFSLALMVQYWLMQLDGPETDAARQLFQTIVFCIVYVVLVLVFIPVVGRLNRTHGRAKVETLVSVVAFFGFVLPSWIQETNSEKATGNRAAAVQALIDQEIGLRTRWISDIRAAGAHGPAGQTPPMIEVENRGGAIEVTNLAGRDLCLRVARVSENPAGATYRCQFRELESHLHCVTLRASTAQSFSRKHADCDDMPLEFSVGDFEHDEVGWWSDSALVDLEAATGRLRANLGVFDYRDYSDIKLREETARLLALNADAERAGRWHEDVEFWTRLRN